jgi:hypothetical protein
MTALLLAVGLAFAHKGHTGDAAPWHACEAQPVGASCSFSPPSGDLHRGTCRQIQGSMMCVRNQPIVPAGEGGAGVALWAAGGAALVGLVGVGWALRRRGSAAETSTS